MRQNCAYARGRQLSRWSIDVARTRCLFTLLLQSQVTQVTSKRGDQISHTSAVSSLLLYKLAT